MAASYPQVVLFGDSLLQGAADTNDGFSFEAALQSHLIRRYDIINRGFSGYNSSQALRILPDVFPAPTSGTSPKLEYLIVLLGANDAALELPVDSQHVDIDRFTANIKNIVTHPHITAHKPKILLVTPPPLDENRAPFGARKAKISASYSEAVRKVAAEVEKEGTASVVLVDLWKALMDKAVSETPGFVAGPGRLLGDPSCGPSGYLETLLSDGLHLASKGYMIFFDIVVPHIKPDQTDNGWVYPEWRKAPWLDS